MIRFEDLTLPAAIEVCRSMRPRDADSLRALLGTLEADSFAVSRWQTDGPAWVMCDEQGPLAIGGLEFRAPWVGCLWFLAHRRVDDMAPTHETWRKLMRHTRTVIANAIDPSNPHARRRVEAHVIGDWSSASRLVRHLGLEREGICRCAGSGGEDLEIWACVSGRVPR